MVQPETQLVLDDPFARIHWELPDWTWYVFILPVGYSHNMLSLVYGGQLLLSRYTLLWDR